MRILLLTVVCTSMFILSCTADKWEKLSNKSTVSQWKFTGTSHLDNEILQLKTIHDVAYFPSVYKNFELEFECKTDSNAVAGLFFHSQCLGNGKPAGGYEVLINNNIDPSEWRKTGSLSAVRNVAKRTAANGTWVPVRVVVTGKQIRVYVNNIWLVDYMEPVRPYREQTYAGRLLSKGCFAFINYRTATASFRNIRVRALANNIKSDMTRAVDETTDEIIRLHQQNFPVIDYHIHLKGGWTKEQAAEQSRRLGITYAIAPNCGKNFPVTNDAGINEFLDTMRLQPFLLAMQAEGREWVTMFSHKAMDKFDFRFTDAMTWTDHKNRRMRLWIKEETFVDDKQQFMDMLVDRAVGIISTEPIHIYVNPTFIPDTLQAEYNTLWTTSRMQRVIDACVKHQVAIEINNRYRYPSPTFIKLAKKAGAKFTFGTNNSNANTGKLEYAIEMIRECELSVEDLFIPESKNF